MNKEFYTTQKMKFSIKDFLSKWEKPRVLFYVVPNMSEVFTVALIQPDGFSGV